MVRYAVPRIYIGPETNEVIVTIGRMYNIGFADDKPNVTMYVTRRKRGVNEVSEWVSYVVDKDGHAHFEIPDSFIDDPDLFPRGMYNVQVFIGDTCEFKIELVKAPGHYVKKVRTIEDKCHGNTKWIEPNCDIQEDPCGCKCNGEVDKPCNCTHMVKNNCVTCFNVVKVATINLAEGYGEWTEKEPPTTPKCCDDDDADECEVTLITNLHIDQDVITSDIIDGYINDTN